MRRRRVLVLSGLTVTGLAGCSSNTNPPRTTSSPNSPTSERDKTHTSTDSATTLTGVSLSAELDSLQPAIVTQQSEDSIDVESAENTQYLYLHVTVNSGTAPARENFRVTFDESEFGPVNQDRQLWRAHNHGNSRYDAENGGGWLLVPLPETGDASDIAVTTADGSGAWPIGSLASMDFDGRLESKSPPLSLEWSVPDTVEPGATPTLSFTVTNEGNQDGMFVAALNRSGPSIAMAPIAAIREMIPPGEPTTFEIRDNLAVENPGNANTGDGDPDMRYDLHWTGGSRSQQIRVAESSN